MKFPVSGFFDIVVFEIIIHARIQRSKKFQRVLSWKSWGIRIHNNSGIEMVSKIIIIKFSEPKKQLNIFTLKMITFVEN